MVAGRRRLAVVFSVGCGLAVMFSFGVRMRAWRWCLVSAGGGGLAVVFSVVGRRWAGGGV